MSLVIILEWYDEDTHSYQNPHKGVQFHIWILSDWT